MGSKLLRIDVTIRTIILKFCIRRVCVCVCVCLLCMCMCMCMCVCVCVCVCVCISNVNSVGTQLCLSLVIEIRNKHRGS
jgi:hypothetical protein